MNRSAADLNDAVLGNAAALDALLDPLQVDLLPLHDDACGALDCSAKSCVPFLQPDLPVRTDLRRRLPWLGG